MSMLPRPPMPPQMPPMAMPPQGPPQQMQQQPMPNPMPQLPAQMPQSNPIDAQIAQARAAAEAKKLLSDEEFTKLKNRVKDSYEQLSPKRKQRLATIQQYLGAVSAGSNTQDEETLVNMLDQMAEVYMQKLASGNPQCLVLTNKLGFRANARYFQLSLNYVMRHIGFREALKIGVLESLFSMMIMKCGVERPEVAQRNYPFDVSAMPFVEAVWFEDWVHDTTVTRLDQCRFYGDKYEMSKEDLRADPRNDQEVVEQLDQGPPNALDHGGQDSATDLGGKQSSFGAEQDKDRVWLWDIYMPRKNLVVTFAINGGDKPLRVIKWDGPPTGPYRVGRYKLVPNQVMPKPPAVDGAPLAKLHNRLFTKLGRQASRQKVVGFATMAAGKDAEAIVRAEDGQVLNVMHPEAVRQMAFGGIDQGNLTFAQVVKQEANLEWGNIDALGGLSTSADTLGQEQLLQGGASGRIQAMQIVVHEVTVGLMRDIGWYLWNDPLVRVEVTDKIPKSTVTVGVQWPVQQQPDGSQHDLRQGEYNDLNFEIVPYSMTEKPPEQRMGMLRQIWQQDLLPIAPILQAQGITLDAQAYVGLLEEYSGLPELSSVIQMSQTPAQPDEEPANTGPMKPPVTTRTYDNRGSGGGGQDSIGQLIGNMPAGKPLGGVA